MSNYIIETRQLVKFYGTKCIIYNLDLQVPPGGIFGFLGPNGAGKSTTIKLLLGLLRPTSGEIFLFGRPLQNYRLEILKKIGYLPEKPILYERTTVLDYVMLFARMHGIPGRKAREKSLAMLDFFGVGKHALSLCQELSAGQRQRVGLAQAFVHDPELIILDEPTQNLDPLGRMQIFGKLRELVEEKGKTIFYSSHILPEAQKICDSIGIINEGSLVTTGSMAEIISRSTDNEFIVVVDKPTELLTVLRERQKASIISMHEKDHQLFLEIFPEKVASFKRELLQIIQDNKLLLLSFRPQYMPIEKVFIDSLGIRSKGELENVTE